MTLKTHPFTPYKGSMCYAEAVHGDIMIGIVNEKGEELCKPMYCKDFLQDMFASEKSGKKSSIWGFSWPPGQIPFSSPTFKWSIHFANKTLRGKAFRIQDLLNKWEKHLGAGFEPPSKVEATEKELVVILTFPRGWMEQPIRVSAVSLLLRVATEFGTHEHPLEFMERVAATAGSIPEKLKDFAFYCDPGYVKRSLDRWQSLWKTKKWEPQTWEMYEGNISELHHHSGMVSYKRERTG